MSAVRTLAICAFLGFGAGWIMPFITVPFLSSIICYFIGIMCGRWLAGVIDRRLGNNLTKTVVFGLLIGMSMSPYHVMPVLIFETIQTSMMAGEIFGGLYNAIGAIFTPLCFIVGVLRPAIWGERW
jgi:Na+-translocating ferredoxin:NAD+ oxidoreductase RnfD subunit